MGGLYHGRILLHWCDSCHTPVLAERCACGADTRPVPVTPPGDARPAFPDDIAFVNTIYQEQFGMSIIPDGQIALLNKVPDHDRMEEIIVGGAIVGAIRYLPEERRWEALPRPDAALISTPKKRFMIIDEGALSSIREGRSLLAPGLVSCDPSVREGDEVFMMTPSGICAGVGRARMDAEEANRMERGQVVKTRKNIPSAYIPGTASWDDAVAANAEVLARAEAASGKFIADHIGPYEHLPMSVSYSGGKDSLATLLVVMNTYRKIPILYIDTGLEFPSTEENVRAVRETYDLECIRIASADEFWRDFEISGPPARDNRWCCKTSKLEPLRQHIISSYGEDGEIVSFIGQRKYESFSRMKNPRVWRNSYVKNQICLAPIHTWTALHVWLYIFREKAPYNRLYRHGVDRMGCYMCPASDLGILEKIKALHPDLWQEWEQAVLLWMNRHGISHSWFESGKWRTRGDEAA
ncbi:MAG TPA: phosphoadenosine phosphosulfate reductase family protein [Methanospirillum sp.]|uniref:phosphoadenosine phosphosulfate reductase domain-containing protein n=1 Tax=Methanospirillum sp. TaxID=45200 RepID=UPI002C6137CD|nr:phosphoadenosine phosphosulfate reductase family protein [Methanospirillum sp.]HOJ96621.1 phosphoadenosine phosphosulfate reductase family protein [Methanospirillum sp.]HOL41412.1 phosphoadenosine phosphosulfate reductase family protein [Methanospirillum sp.]